MQRSGFLMSFESLPDELLPAVFSHVSPGTLLKLSLVCALTLQGHVPSSAALTLAN